MMICTGSCTARTQQTITLSLGAFQVYPRRLQYRLVSHRSSFTNHTSEQHLLQRTCLLLRELIFEVDVDKTTPKRCITPRPTG